MWKGDADFLEAGEEGRESGATRDSERRKETWNASIDPGPRQPSEPACPFGVARLSSTEASWRWRVPCTPALASVSALQLLTSESCRGEVQTSPGFDRHLQPNVGGWDDGYGGSGPGPALHQ